MPSFRLYNSVFLFSPKVFLRYPVFRKEVRICAHGAGTIAHMNIAEFLPSTLAALLAGFYISQVPVIVALAARSDAFGIGVGAFAWAGAVRRAEARAVSGKKRSTPKIERKDWLRLLKYVLKRGSFEYLRVSGVVSLSDAAATCLFAGGIRAVCAALGPRGEARVVPSFSGGKTDLELNGIMSVRLGHIMLAACMFAAMLARKGWHSHGKIPD